MTEELRAFVLREDQCITNNKNSETDNKIQPEEQKSKAANH